MKQREEVAHRITDSLKAKSSYVYYPGVTIEPCPHCGLMTKNDFEYKKVKGTYFTIEDAFVIQGVHTLGYATVTTLSRWLSLLHKKYPKKSIPDWDDKKLTSRLVFLSKQGLLTEYDFVSEKKVVIHVFVCNSYGHLYFRNLLDVYSSYDQSCICRNEMEIFKRLATNQVAYAFINHGMCKDISVNLRCTDDNPKYKGYIYGKVTLEQSEETKTTFILEPMSFATDTRVMVEEESTEKLRLRLEKLEELVKHLNDTEPTKLILIVENYDGLKKLLKLISERSSEFYQSALYTSENIIARSGGRLEHSFLKLNYNEEGRPELRPIKEGWEFE